MVCCLQRCSGHCSRRGRSYPGRRVDTCRIAAAVRAQAGRVRTDDRRGSEAAEEKCRIRCREQGSKAGCSAIGLPAAGCGLAVLRCRDQDPPAPNVSVNARQVRDTPQRYPLSCLSPARFRH